MISRQQARQQIEKLIQQYDAIPDAERPNLTEANVLHQFIDPLLQALGFPPTPEGDAKKATLLRVFDETNL